jgi:hypothetical protein
LAHISTFSRTSSKYGHTSDVLLRLFLALAFKRELSLPTSSLSGHGAAGTNEKSCSSTSCQLIAK